MEVTPNESTTDIPKLPRDQTDEVNPFDFKTLTTTLEDLTAPEKSILEQMIEAKDEELLLALKANEAVSETVLSLIRRKLENPVEVEEEHIEAQEHTEAFEKALVTMRTNKQALLRSGTRAILKLLQNLKRRPEQLKNRRHRMDNIIIKKYVLEIAGALDFMKAVGFVEVESDKFKYLEIVTDTSSSDKDTRQLDQHKLDHAIALLEAGIQETVAAPSAPAEKKMCVGGCGFWGDEKQESYCSLCFKKKMCGVKISTKEAKEEEKPSKCIKECGFFGAKKFGGMCSVCFSKNPPPAVVADSKEDPPEEEEPETPRPVQTNTSRCWQCKRKIGIVGIECRCGYLFCGKHRYADEHNCDFDHRANHQKKLRKDNIAVVARKFEGIDG